MPEPGPLAAAIAQLEAQREVLGDAVVDAAVQALRRSAGTDSASTSGARLRQVSVLFVDVVESTSMLERVSVEDAQELVSGAVERFGRIVQSHGGQILQFTGDGLKAAFGSLTSREDDAAQAVLAGLRMLEAAAEHAARVARPMGIETFNIRVGIHTGMVLLGSGVDADRSAMGHAVHLAARMEQSAPVGRLRISDATWAQVRGLFIAQEQPPLQVKGHSEPLRTWLVDRKVEDPEGIVESGLDGPEAPMVGRDGELAALVALHDRCVRKQATGWALVLGEAGLGKTRLRHELLQALKLRQGDAGLLQARAQPSMTVQAHGLLRQLLVRWFQIRDDASGEQARRQLLDGLGPWLGAEGAHQAPRVGHLIGMDFSQDPAVQGLPAATLRKEAFAAIRRALLARAAKEPLVLVLDDLHWADPGSLDFVQTLLQPAPAPLMVMALARPSLLERGIALEPAADDQSLTLHLAPLDRGDEARLVQALLAPLPEVPQALYDVLLQRAGGNPFYLEALVRMLIDDGVIDARQKPWVLRQTRLAALRVPETLVAVLQARLDALPADVQSALQRASIVGPVFWDAALAAIDDGAPQALPQLEQRALVQAAGNSTFADTAERRFAHALLHEVTYGTVLKAERVAGHAAVAHWLAERVGERAGEFLALTAEHFERGGDSARALEYWDLAWRDASRRYANEAALHAAGRALAQSALTDPRWRFWIMSQRQNLLGDLGRVVESRQALVEMSEWAERHNDDAMRASLLSTRMLIADHEARHDDAARIADEIVALADRSGDDSLASSLALAHGERAWLATMQSDWPTVDREIEAGLVAARRAASVDKRHGGYDGYQHQLRAIQLQALAQQDRHADVLLAVEQALKESGLRLRDRYNLLILRVPSERLLGRIEEACSTSLEALELTRQLGIPRLQVIGLNQCASSAIEAGRLDEARVFLEEAETLTGSLEEASYDAPYTTELKGRLALRQERPGDARNLWCQAISRYDAQGRVQPARALRCQLSRLDQAAGAESGAKATVEAVLAEAAGPVGRHDLPPAALLAAYEVLAGSDAPHSEELLVELRARLAEQLEALPDEESRRLLARVPHWAVVMALG